MSSNAAVPASASAHRRAFDGHTPIAHTGDIARVTGRLSRIKGCPRYRPETAEGGFYLSIVTSTPRAADRADYLRTRNTQVTGVAVTVAESAGRRDHIELRRVPSEFE
ncbi:hypothetical protein [Nocardia sp. CY15]|uniref:hypothetical protein n=1 Tax=Nocardia sp. CY15 TaxID=2608687 RepID=UPI001356D70F|nr:hypothetical protein [Nocardia sp. CY15]